MQNSGHRVPPLVHNPQQPTREHQLFHRFENVLKRASRVCPWIPEPAERAANNPAKASRSALSSVDFSSGPPTPKALPISFFPCCFSLYPPAARTPISTALNASNVAVLIRASAGPKMW
jgi:hypothetical protein